MALKLTDLTSAHLLELNRLIPEKEKLSRELRAVEAKIVALAGGDVGNRKVGKAGTGRRGPKKGSKPGRLKEAVLGGLASGTGLTVKELAQKIKVKPANLYAWFYTTGRKVPGLRKVGGKYVFSGDKKP